jgi:hypothetical protein
MLYAEKRGEENGDAVVEPVEGRFVVPLSIVEGVDVGVMR